MNEGIPQKFTVQQVGSQFRILGPRGETVGQLHDTESSARLRADALNAQRREGPGRTGMDTK